MKGVKILCICVGLLFLIPLNTVLADSHINVAQDNNPRETIYYVDDELDQEQNEGDLGYKVCSLLWYAQSFKPSLEQTTRVQLLMSKTKKSLSMEQGVIAKFIEHIQKVLMDLGVYEKVKMFLGGKSFPLWGLGDITLSIREEIDGEDLTVVSIPVEDVLDDGAWVDFDFPDINVTYGQTYYMVVRADGGDIDKNYYTWYYTDRNNYNSGNMFHSLNGGSSWTEKTSYEGDFAFKTYGMSPSEEPDGIVNRWGIFMYDTAEDLKGTSVNSCETFKGVLSSNPEWEPDHIWIYNYDEERNKVKNKLSELDDLENEDDIIIFMYAGHTPGLSWLNPYLDRFGSDNIAIILGTCYAGTLDSYLGENGREILASSRSNEESWWWSTLNMDVFCYYVCYGLRGAAEDKNYDGWISTREVFDFAGPSTTSFMQSKGTQQHPQFFDHIPGRDIPLVST